MYIRSGEMQIQMRKLILILLILLIPTCGLALDVIPGLKVFGGDTRGAYGNGVDPTICIVDDTDPDAALAEDTRNGVTVLTGGFTRFVENDTDLNGFCTALDTPFDCCTGNDAGNCEENKLIIFETSGVITDFEEIKFQDDYITVAGQTAPSPGISIHGSQFTVSGDHVVMQHLRVRAGDNSVGVPGQNRNAIEAGGDYNILDHMTFSWAPDTTAYVGGSYSSMSNSIISEGLRYSIHDDNIGGQHSSNFALTGSASQYTMAINNLISHAMWRNPKTDPPDQKLLIANNMAYNPGNFNLEIGEGVGQTACQLSIVGNISMAGIDSSASVKTRYPHWINTQNAGSDIYLDDNKFCDEYGGTCDTQDDSEDWDEAYCGSGDPDCTTVIANNQSLTPPFAYPTGYTPMAVTAVEAYIIANVGARPDDRDEVDTRIVGDITEEGGARAGIIDTIEYVNADCTAQYYVGAQVVNCCTGSGTGTCEQNDEAGWPTLAANIHSHDDDFPTDVYGDADADGYTDLEEFNHIFATHVEGGSVNVQNVSTPDGSTGVSITATVTSYLPAPIDSVDIWLDEGTCEAEAGTTLVSDDDVDGAYDMSTLSHNTQYCVGFMANYEGTSGTRQDYDFTTTTQLNPPTPSGGGIVYNKNAGSLMYNKNAGTQY